MYVEIDSNSGFCFGVVRAITKAESALKEYGGEVFSLGDIVHNRMEVLRLEHLGLRTVTYADMPSLSGRRLFIRAHGEPPRPSGGLPSWAYTSSMRHVPLWRSCRARSWRRTSVWMR